MFYKLFIIHAIVDRECENFSRQIKRTTRITDVEHGLSMTAGSGGELKRAATAGLQRSKYELNTMTRGKCEMHASRRSRVNTHPLINC